MTDAASIGGAVTVISGIIAALAERNRRAIKQIEVKVDGQLALLLKTAKQLANERGQETGRKKELKRSQFIKLPTESPIR